MNRAHGRKERPKHRKFLRIEKIKAVHPDLRITQKGRVAEPACEPFHTVGMIRIAPLHARRKIFHDDRKIRKFLR